MTDVLPDNLQSPNVKRRKVETEKGLLDLPVNLMYEVFGPLEARSLLEMAKSHPILRQQVVDWPGKRWEIVHLANGKAIIDYETFEDWEAEVLLGNAEYKRDDTTAANKTLVNICHLPYDLLWPILQPLDENARVSVAKCHPNLLRATRNLNDKRFDIVDCYSNEVGLYVGHYGHNPGYSSWTHNEAEILLTGSTVHELLYDVQTTIAPDLCLNRLIFLGEPENAHKCAGLIEKWKPSNVDFTDWNAEVINAIPELRRVLKDVRRLKFDELPVEWLSDIPDWGFEELDFSVDTAEKNAALQLQSMCQKLYDQWMSSERHAFVLFVRVNSLTNDDSFEVGGISTRLGGRHAVERPDGTVLYLGCNRSIWMSPYKDRFYMHTS